MIDTTALDLSPLVDASVLPDSIEALVIGWAIDDPLVGSLEPAGVAIALHHGHLVDSLDLAWWGCPTGVPLPFLLSPGELRAHLRHVARSSQTGEPGRN